MERLLELTGLQPSELRKQIISLSMPEHPVLKMIDEDVKYQMQPQDTPTVQKHPLMQ